MTGRPPSANAIGADLEVEPLGMKEFRRVAHALFTDAGITMPDSKLTLVHSRLSKRLRALKMQRFEEYCDFIESAAGAIERRSLLTALTTNVTRFFREPHHFDMLKAELLPPLLRKAKQGARVRLWSAGCSSGEEPYSIAMTLLSLAPDASKYDIRILASDIDPNILGKAKAGLYTDGQMKGLGNDLRAKYFERPVTSPHREDYQVRDSLKELISFRELNLTQRWPFKGPFDIIFCRNVVIYFNEPTAQKVWSQFSSVLGPGGYLLVGHSERVSGPSLAQFNTTGVTTYQRK
jgi:chemotaxis protein methyltransferase CheR